MNSVRKILIALPIFSVANRTLWASNQPTSLDASAYGILVNTLGCPIESPLKVHALGKQNLLDYCRRMQAEFFPELPWGGV
ncbi:glutathione S-transferase C-terminal domain-containing protein [Methyloglobulus sp.]|uniref:glutathione S-transferase C-terminal domain-containing protein n=1 Tax=Methyloglobulus sp. TaxID=2518622 RepID=UPI00398949B0